MGREAGGCGIAAGVLLRVECAVSVVPHYIVILSNAKNLLLLAQYLAQH